jgi:hypothetical protein
LSYTPLVTSPSASSSLSRRSSPKLAPLAERIVSGALACLFLFGAAVQYNDPDPIRWAAIYLAATAVCVGHATRPMPFAAGAVVAVASLIWAIVLAPDAFRVVPSLSELTGTFQMMAPGVEELREFVGLLILTASTGVLAFRARRRSAVPGDEA